MTSEPSAEPRTSTPGPSDSSTAGSEGLTGIAQMAIGSPHAPRVLGCFERDLYRALRQHGLNAESTSDIVHLTTPLVRELLRGSRFRYAMGWEAINVPTMALRP